MRKIFHQKNIFHGAVPWMLVLLVLYAPRTAAADTVDIRYPGLSSGLLKSAVPAPLDQDTLLAADGIRQYLVQDKKQQAVKADIDSLGETIRLRINAKWLEAQIRLAMDNPVDRARRSGKPTMVEFGATGCVPCDMMQTILDKLRKDYPSQLNVVFVHVGEEQILAARYGIRSIPV